MDDLFPVADHERVDELGHGFGAERLGTAGDHQRMALVAIHRAQRHAGELEHHQHVRVLELVLEREAEHVELARGRVRIDGEERDAEPPHLRLGVGPGCERQLARGVRPAVHDVVEDADPQVREPDLVGVRERDQHAHVGRAERLRRLAQRAAQVAIGLGDARQELVLDELFDRRDGDRHANVGGSGTAGPRRIRTDARAGGRGTRVRAVRGCGSKPEEGAVPGALPLPDGA
jgi:hypothetical protein